MNEPNKVTERQQLRLIEGMCIVFQDGNTMDAERSRKILDQIYKLAHLNGSCENPHQDWHDEAIELGKSLKEQGICDFTR